MPNAATSRLRCAIERDMDAEMHRVSAKAKAVRIHASRRV
jgi:hypothetical protein